MEAASVSDETPGRRQRSGRPHGSAIIPELYCAQSFVAEHPFSNTERLAPSHPGEEFSFPDGC